jgi:hypothetical protein
MFIFVFVFAIGTELFLFTSGIIIYAIEGAFEF